MSQQRKGMVRRKNRTCTCKYLPWNLSTNTAAEYGDLGTLTHRITHGKSSASVSQPLHLAAQHGHIAATSFLLQNGYNADYGAIPDANSDAESESIKNKSSTPLHRACFSGAIGCVKLLLDHGANLEYPDHSFHDGMTPLHKAVKGGRYNVVALILKHAAETDRILLKRILHARDSYNRTPLELALALDAKGEEEILSLRRWDSVAGGPANFVECVKLLERALSGDGQMNRSYLGAGVCNFRPKPFKFTSLCECGDDEEEKCKTAAWEESFSAAILKSTESMLALSMKDVACTVNYSKENTAKAHSDEVPSLTSLLYEEDQSFSNATNSNHNSTQPKGYPCAMCHQASYALFRSSKGSLVCRKCLRRSKYK